MWIKAFGLALMGLVSLGVEPAGAQQEPPSENAIYDSLRFQEGEHHLGDGLATLKAGTRFRYLNNEDTQKLLTKVWGNPPGAGADSLGALVPAGEDLRADDAWIAIIDYEPSGYVSDEDANAIDYPVLLRDMQKSMEETSKDRVAQGYSAIKLLGWAHEPYYDSTTKKLYWAKRLQFGEGEGETLNYNIRILGRSGYIGVNIVSDMGSLQKIDGKVDSVLSAIDFNKGHLYAEYDANVDEAAAYGIAGLVAGGVMAKTGILKAIIAFLLAFKKAIIIGLLALVAPAWKLFKRFTGRKGPDAS